MCPVSADAFSPQGEQCIVSLLAAPAISVRLLLPITQLHFPIELQCGREYPRTSTSIFLEYFLRTQKGSALTNLRRTTAHTNSNIRFGGRCVRWRHSLPPLTRATSHSPLCWMRQVRGHRATPRGARGVAIVEGVSTVGRAAVGSGCGCSHDTVESRRLVRCPTYHVRITVKASVGPQMRVEIRALPLS